MIIIFRCASRSRIIQLLLHMVLIFINELNEIKVYDLILLHTIIHGEYSHTTDRTCMPYDSSRRFILSMQTITETVITLCESRSVGGRVCCSMCHSDAVSLCGCSVGVGSAILSLDWLKQHNLQSHVFFPFRPRKSHSLYSAYTICPLPRFMNARAFPSACTAFDVLKMGIKYTDKRWKLERQTSLSSVNLTVNLRSNKIQWRLVQQAYAPVQL